MFSEKGVAKNFAKFTKKPPTLKSFFNKAPNFIKKKLRCFPVNVAKIIKNIFLQNTSGGCYCINIQRLYFNLMNIHVAKVTSLRANKRIQDGTKKSRGEHRVLGENTHGSIKQPLEKF